MTRSQTILIKTAQRQLGLDDGEYRLILRNVAGVESSTELSNDNLERVLGFFESRGWRMPGKSASHFRDKVNARGTLADARQIYRIRQICDEAGIEEPLLVHICDQHSGGRVQLPERLTPNQAWKVTEALKAIAARRGTGVSPVPPIRVHLCPSVVNESAPLTEEEIPF